jgi:glucoamylase
MYVALKAPARIHFGINGWKEIQDIDTKDTGLGIHIAKLPVKRLKDGDSFQFTFYWLEPQAWEGQDYWVSVREPTPEAESLQP